MVFWLYLFNYSFGLRIYEGILEENMCGYFFDGEGGVLVYVFVLFDGWFYFDEEEIFIDFFE